MLRSPHDKAIAALAVPALGALAAEPLFVLGNTAAIGHLGTVPLAALALASTVLTTAFTVLNFLTYGTTARVARFSGAGDAEAARAIGAQAYALAGGVGLVLAATLALLAGPLTALTGGDGEVAEAAAPYLRIAALGAPGFLLAAAGQGYLRGMGDLRTPLYVLAAAQAANLAGVLLVVEGLGGGLVDSAWATVAAQTGMGLAFVARHRGWARPSLTAMRPLMRIGGEIAVRTSALLGCFLVASAVLAREGAADLAAHQIAFQLYVFLALLLDSLAIAAQVLVGRALGADAAARARAVSRRVIGWSVVIGAGFAVALVALEPVVPGLFTDDPVVVGRAEAIWLLLALLFPLNGAVFALDGILIGAGDTRFLAASMVAAAALFLPAVLLADGIRGVWVALAGLLVVRAATTGARFAGPRWTTAGAAR